MPRRKGSAFTVLVGLFVVLVIVVMCQRDETANKTSSTPQPAPVVYTPEQQLADFQTWNAILEDTMGKFDEHLGRASEALSLFSNGRITVYAAYSTIASIRDLYDTNWRKFRDIVPAAPRSLSADHQKKLNDARELLETAMYMRWVALESLLAYLDAPSPAKLRQVNKEFDDVKPVVQLAASEVILVKLELEVAAGLWQEK